MKITRFEAWTILGATLLFLMLACIMAVTLGFVANGNVIAEPNRSWAIIEFSVFVVLIGAIACFFAYWLNRIRENRKSGGGS